MNKFQALFTHEKEQSIENNSSISNDHTDLA